MSTESWKFWYQRKEGTFEPEIPKLEELLKENSASKILDFGCGAGRHTAYLAKRGFEVYGFDASPTAIARTRALLKREHLRADLRVWDMLQPLPYENEFFDALLAVKVIHHTYMDKIKKIFKEIDRVLKKGGFLYLQVSAYSRGKQRIKSEEPEPRTYLHLEGEEKGIPHHEFTKRELLTLLKNFKIEELHSKTEHYRGYCLIARKKSQ